MIENLPQLIRLPEACKMLGRSRNGILCLEKSDPTFPRRIKLGTSRVAPVYYDLAELRAWLETKKRGACA